MTPHSNVKLARNANENENENENENVTNVEI